LHFLPFFFLIEAKNHATAVSSKDVGWFIAKLEKRGLEFGILVAYNGITGSDRRAAWSEVAIALSKGIRLVVLTESEIRGLRDDDDLVSLMQKKICELVLIRSL